MTKQQWMKNSTLTVILSTSLLMGGQVGQAATSSQNSAKAVEIVKIAKSLVGKDFKYGSEGPSSFGSAGFATYAYAKVGIKIDDTIAELYKDGQKVSKSNIKPGDLVFFSTSGSGDPTFMGIFIGDNKFVYSSMGSDEVVTKTFSQFSNKYLGARSYLQVDSVSKFDVLAAKVIKTGEKYDNTPYKFGSSSSTTRTFDCSSFTQRVFKEAGIISLPRDSRQQSAVGKTVSLSNMKKGDLIFMRSSHSSSDRITHVAIYAGNGKILHTYGSPGVTYSKFSNTNWEKRVVKVKRVIPE